jgi:hypothetical protein
MRIPEREEVLATQIRSFLSHKSPISDAIKALGKEIPRFVVFGGALRDIVGPDKGQRTIRDVDVVVSGADLERLARVWSDHVESRNRFGGLRIKYGKVPFDVWAVEKTWAFQQKHIVSNSFYQLTSTTFLNIDGIIADMYYGRTRLTIKVMARDFFQAFDNQVLEITLKENPFPKLVAIKALRAMHRYDLKVGFKLAWYFCEIFNHYSARELEEEQQRHYHRVIFHRDYLEQFRDYITMELKDNASFGKPLRLRRQLKLPLQSD